MRLSPVRKPNLMQPQPPRRTTHTAADPTRLLVYDRWGHYGRPVVLLHGLLFDRTMWWPVAAELATACTVVAPDLPGHGQSPARTDNSLERIAADLATLVHNLGLHRAPVIVGHATSARLATTFADAYATHHVLTIDEPDTDLTGVDDLIRAAHLQEVPEMYRPYAQPRHDSVLLRAYDSWLVQPPDRRSQPAMAGSAANRPPAPQRRFAHLTNPAGFAAELRDLL
jgi:pimeloyl-ACP methyl ester carboxylesterase